MIIIPIHLQPSAIVELQQEIEAKDHEIRVSRNVISEYKQKYHTAEAQRYGLELQLSGAKATIDVLNEELLKRDRQISHLERQIRAFNQKTNNVSIIDQKSLESDSNAQMSLDLNKSYSIDGKQVTKEEFEIFLKENL